MPEEIDQLIWNKLPHDVQRVLFDKSNLASSLNLHFEDNGDCISVQNACESLGRILLRIVNVHDTIRYVTEFAIILSKQPGV